MRHRQRCCWIVVDGFGLGPWRVFVNTGGHVCQFQAGEDKPELHGQWDDFNSPSEEDPGIGC